MKFFLSKLVILWSFFCFMGSVKAESYDRPLHFSTTYGLTLTGYLAMRKFGAEKNTAFIVSAALISFGGLLKETVYDKKFDVGDVGANTFGCLSAGGMIWMFEF